MSNGCNLCQAHQRLLQTNNNNAANASTQGQSASAAASANHDSDSEPAPLLPSNNRSRQKKFMKTFSQLPQGELVLQRE